MQRDFFYWIQIYIYIIDICLGIDVTVCVCFRLEWDLKDFEEDLDKALDHFRGLVRILNWLLVHTSTLESFKHELGHHQLRFDEGGVYSWLTVQSLANRYEYIDCNDTFLTSSRDVYFSWNGLNFTQKSSSFGKYFRILTVFKY